MTYIVNGDGHRTWISPEDYVPVLENRIAALEAELEPWREMARQLEALQAQEPTSFEIHISWDRTEPDCFWIDVEREKGKGPQARWYTVADGEGDTLPAAVAAAYSKVVGDA